MQTTTSRSWRHAPPWARRVGGVLDISALALVASSPVLVGGMLPAAQAGWSAAALVLLLSAAALHAATGSRWRWEGLSVALVGLAALTLFRATPAGVVLAGEFERTVAGLWPDGSVRGTIAPGRAPLAALRLLGVAAVVQLFAVRFRGRGGSGRAARAVFGAVAVAVGVGMLHRGAELETIYGAFTPVDMRGLRSPLAAPFVNENQAGALWALGGVLAWCAAAVDYRRRQLGLVVGVVLVACAGVFLRAYAATAAALAAGAFLAMALIVGDGDRQRYGRALFGGVALVCTAWAVVAWFVLPGVALEVATLDKADQWNAALAPIARRPFGYGPGALPDLFGAFEPVPSRLRATWLESAPLQLGADHGWLPAALVFGLIGRMLYRRLTVARREERDMRAVSAALAVYVGCEAITGMGLEALGYAFPVAALVGVAQGRSRRRDQGNSSPMAIAAGASALGLIAWAGAAGLGPSVAIGDEHVGARLREVQLADGVASDAFGEALTELSQLVPGDVVLLSYAADRALAQGDPAAAGAIVDYLGVVAPGREVTWQIAVDVGLAVGDRDAACAAAARLAEVARDPARLIDALTLIEADPREWPGCVGGPEARGRMYQGLRQSERVEDGFALALRTLRSEPDDADSLAAALEGAVAIGVPGAAVSYGERLLALRPDDVVATVLTARMHAEVGSAEAGIRLLDAALERRPGDADLLLERLAMLAASDGAADPEQHDLRFRQEYQRILARVSGTRADSIRRLRIGGAYFVTREDWPAAENAYRALLRLDPSDPRAQRALEEIARRRARSRP